MALLLVVGAFAVLLVTGWLLLAPLERSQRDELLPVAPLFGAVGLIVVLHDTTLIMSVRHGMVLVVMGLALLVAVAHRRDPTWWRPSRRALATLGLTVVCAVLPGVWILGPSFAMGDSNVIQPSTNNDAFYYVTVAGWLQDHAETERPVIGASPADPGLPPSFSTAKSHLDLDLRIGQELTHAGLSTVLGSNVERTWYPITALWVLLLPASGMAAAICFRMRRSSGLLLGTAISTSSLVVFQFVSQNSDSLLGTALLPLALGLVVRGVGRHPVVPLVLSAASLTALIGTYTEFSPLIGPALVAAVVLRRSPDRTRAMRSALQVLAVAVVLAPLAWVRAVKSLLFLGSIGSDTFPSAFAGQPLQIAVARFLGLIGPDAIRVSRLVLFLGLLVVLIGVGAAAVLSRRRWFFAALLMPGLFLAFYLVTVRERPYTQQRVVQLLLPLVLLVAAIGWDALVTAVGPSWRPGRGRRAQRRAWPSNFPALVAVVVALGFLAANCLTADRYHIASVAKTRHVGPEFTQAAKWVRSVGGQNGGRVAVLVGDFFNQLWITDALRNEPKVAYPSLFVSYQLQQQYWDGRPRRWLLVDSAALVHATDAAVVHRNDRFTLLDMRRGRVAVAVPADEFGQHSYIIMRSSSAPTHIELHGLVRPRNSTDPVSQPGYGETFAAEALQPGMTTLNVDVPGSAIRLDLTDGSDVFDLRAIALGRKDDAVTPTTGGAS